MGLARPVVAGAGQGVEDAGQRRLAEMAVDALGGGLRVGSGREVGTLHDRGHDMLGAGLGRGTQGLDQLGPLRGRHIDVPQAPFDGVSRRDGVAGQGQPFADVARALRQEIAATDVGEEANRRLGHGELGALGQHAQLGALADAHAAAHDNAVHQRDVGLRGSGG